MSGAWLSCVWATLLLAQQPNSAPAPDTAPLTVPVQAAPQAGEKPSGAVGAEWIPLAQDELPLQSKEQISTYYEAALSDSENGQDFLETPGYRRLLQHVERYSDEELRAKATRELDVADSLARPDAWRGHLVRVRGIVVGMTAVKLDEPLGERIDVFRAVVTEADGSEGVIIDFLPQPPNVELARDVVDLEAVFYRTVRYETKRGTFRDAPYLVARGLRVPKGEDLRKETKFDFLAAITIGAAVLYIVIRIATSMTRKRASAEASRAREAARALRERAYGPSASSTPPSKNP
jgi:hypothetical protein